VSRLIDFSFIIATDHSSTVSLKLTIHKHISPHENEHDQSPPVGRKTEHVKALASLSAVAGRYAYCGTHRHDNDAGSHAKEGKSGGINAWSFSLQLLIGRESVAAASFRFVAQDSLCFRARLQK
jgi:hypothetical protein